MITSNTTEKRLTSYRLTPLTVDRLKTMAKQKNISVNTLVDKTLTELVRDTMSEEELRTAHKETDEFISEFAGTWSDPEYENIAEEIKKTRTIRKVIDL